MELIDSLTEAPSRARVLALHCAGANGSEWRQLASNLGPQFELYAPNLIGNGGADRWSGKHAFTLSDEAAAAVSIMDAVNEPVHLVGHSYGGAVALRAAIERPAKVASLTLYEPAAFHILRTTPDGRAALVDIDAVASEVGRNVLSGAHYLAARRFFEWANGEGSWETIDREAQNNMVRYIAKVCLEYHAQVNERTPLVAYRRLNRPVLLLQGEYSIEAMRLIVQQLARAVGPGSVQTVYGAGHMGPITHASVVSRMMADHIIAAESRLSQCADESEADHRAA